MPEHDPIQRFVMNGSFDIVPVAESKFLRLVRRGSWEFVTRKRSTGVVIIVPLTADRRVIFVEQFRPPVNRRTVEFPAGLSGDLEGSEEESLEEAARRELLEETGYQAGQMKRVFDGPSSAGLTDEMCAIFVATGLIRSGEGGGDETERIDIHEVPLDEAVAFLDERRRAGSMVCARVFAGLYFLAQEATP
jgi:ADP-ribose pyrophosphatase